MTYHDGNRAAKFRSSRLGAAVEQITGKRTELSLGFTKTAKPRKAKPASASQTASDTASLSQGGKVKGKGRAKKILQQGLNVTACVNTISNALDVTQSKDFEAVCVTAVPILAATAKAAATSYHPSYVDDEDESDEDVFDDNYKKRRKRKT